IAASDARISVRSGPMKFETRNCTEANVMPQIAAAGNTDFKPFHPDMTMIKYDGMNSETGAQMRPTPALNRSTGRLVTAPNVVIEMPMEPNATGGVLANRQMAAAKNGEKPSPVSIAAATATGLPKPEQPSINAPNANAMSRAWRFGSLVRPPIESLMI